MVDDMQQCQAGEHVLFRNDPIMTSHFVNLSQRANVLSERLILISFVGVLSLLCIIIGTSVLVVRRRRRTSSGAEPISSYPRQCDYTPLAHEDVWRIIISFLLYFLNQLFSNTNNRSKCLFTNYDGQFLNILFDRVTCVCSFQWTWLFFWNEDIYTAICFTLNIFTFLNF